MDSAWGGATKREGPSGFECAAAALFRSRADGAAAAVTAAAAAVVSKMCGNGGKKWVANQARTERRDVRTSQDRTRDWVTHRRVAGRESALKKPGTMYGKQGQRVESRSEVRTSQDQTRDWKTHSNQAGGRQPAGRSHQSTEGRHRFLDRRQESLRKRLVPDRWGRFERGRSMCVQWASVRVLPECCRSPEVSRSAARGGWVGVWSCTRRGGERGEEGTGRALARAALGASRRFRIGKIGMGGPRSPAGEAPVLDPIGNPINCRGHVFDW